jgi:hypothetical protein
LPKDSNAKLQELERRIQRLEESACLAKAKCKKCGSDIVILDFNEYVSCDCGELFGDAGPLLAGQFDEINQLEWINKNGYENVLLLGRLRRQFPI